MGRPAGTVETKFTEEEKKQIVESVDQTQVSLVISTKGLSDIADLFNKAGTKNATITRVQLEENAYILHPLFSKLHQSIPSTSIRSFGSMAFDGTMFFGLILS